MVFTLFLCTAQDNDSNHLLFQSHLFSTRERGTNSLKMETSDLEDLSCVGCFLGNSCKPKRHFLFFDVLIPPSFGEVSPAYSVFCKELLCPVMRGQEPYSPKTKP